MRSTEMAQEKSRYDQQIIAQFKAGDSNAFEALVTKYEARVNGIAMRYVSDPSEANDISQETFIRAFRALPAFRGDSEFYTWLYRVTVNTAKNYVMSKENRLRNKTISIGDLEYPLDTPMSLKDNRSPEASLLSAELGEDIKEALSSLPSDLQEIIEQREYYGLSYEIIAKNMNCPVGTVRSRLHRARDKLSQRIEGKTPLSRPG